MKSNFYFILLLAIIWLSCSGWEDINQNNIPKEIVEAIKLGDTEKLANHFSDNVELALFDKEDVYSKVQAKRILENFFKKHEPNNFVLLHQGGKVGSQYAIGNLSTSYEIFRVYFMIKTSQKNAFIHQLRIERETE